MMTSSRLARRLEQTPTSEVAGVFRAELRRERRAARARSWVTNVKLLGMCAVLAVTVCISAAPTTMTFVSR